LGHRDAWEDHRVRLARAVIRPLTSRSTYRRLVFLLLGVAASFGFSAIGVLITLPASHRLSDAPATIRLLVPVVLLLPVISSVGLFRASVAMQRMVARTLLDAEVTDLPAGAAVTWRHRWRSAAFFTAHVATGYVVGTLAVGYVLLALYTIAEYTRPAVPNPLLPVLLAGATAVGLYLAALVGSGFARLAARLLGPTPDERLAALEHRLRHLAEHNRLARELHDSVGHALSVVTVQAAAAQHVLDRSPDVARAALAAIADSARRALADLDHVLALLREEPTSSTHPQRTLLDLDRLLDDLRAAGLSVTARCGGDLAGVPAVVSREAYRIVQEGLTNVLRHAGQVPVEVQIGYHSDGLAVEISNQLPTSVTAPTESSTMGGRGLTGIRERVALLGGSAGAGPRDDRWVLTVRVPPVTTSPTAPVGAA
jgi:signal transduction histidine kinase